MKRLAVLALCLVLLGCGQQPTAPTIIDASNVYLIEGGYCYDVLLSNGQQETWCYRSHGREHIKPVSGRMS